MRVKLLLILILIIVTDSTGLFSQIKGREIPGFNPDTVFIYNSPRPLINEAELSGDINQAWGLDLLFSVNGFGAGIFYQKKFLGDWSFFSSLYISGARNTDEFETWNQEEERYEIPGKLRRLYVIPLTIGFQKYVFRDKLSDNLKPFFNTGLGPSFVLAAPYKGYENSFFSALGHTNTFTRFGFFVGGGANFGSGINSLISFNVRYYFIPFGGNGLESIEKSPISNFGGLFLSLSLGTKF